MNISLEKKPRVRISYDEMEAYLILPTPISEDAYVLKDVLETLKLNGVKIGVDETKVSTMIEERYYDREVLVARGIEVVDGVDAYFDFHFDTDFNKAPSHREDGSVDYWSIHSVEMVEEGQLLATYHEPIMGSNGMNVKGKMLFAFDKTFNSSILISIFPSLNLWLKFASSLNLTSPYMLITLSLEREVK